MSIRKAHAQFVELCSRIGFGFEVRMANVSTNLDPMSGEVWGGKDGSSCYAKVQDGVVVESKIVKAKEEESGGWHVNGAFLRSIYREG